MSLAVALVPFYLGSKVVNHFKAKKQRELEFKRRCRRIDQGRERLRRKRLLGTNGVWRCEFTRRVDFVKGDRRVSFVEKTSLTRA